MGLGVDEMNLVCKWAYSVKKDTNNLISMQLLYDFIEKNPFATEPFRFIKENIITYVITNEMYNRILKRNEFYIMNGEDSTPPKECCFKSICRKLFSDEPDPYHCDFKPRNYEHDKEEFILLVRQRYGYSSRPYKNSVSSIKDRNSIKLLRSSMTRTLRKVDSQNSNKASCTSYGLKSYTTKNKVSVLPIDYNM